MIRTRLADPSLDRSRDARHYIGHGYILDGVFYEYEAGYCGKTEAAGGLTIESGGVEHTIGACRGGAARVRDHARGRGADGGADQDGAWNVVRVHQAHACGGPHRGVRRAARPGDGRPAAQVL